MYTDSKIAGVSMSGVGVLAAELGRFITRFLSLTQPVKALLPVWVLHTFVFGEFEFTPYLNVISPEPGCGKTTAADVLSALCCRATSPTCGTAAVLRRIVAAESPTLLLDEWDTLDDGIRKACLNFLNTGFRKDGTFSFVSGGRIIELSTFCPKAIVGRSVVTLPEATVSRCISFVIHRALPEEKLDKFRATQRAEAALLHERCEEWGEEFRSRLVRVAPNMPENLSARQQDISEVLLAISEDCGGPWPLLTRNALMELFAERQIPTPENELLRAVHRFIEERKPTGHFFSQDFCNWANEQPETPWSEKRLTQAKLAQMLKHYEVFPGQINRLIKGKQKNSRGYHVADFKAAFARYVDAACGPLGC
jgi:hypothetical protein